jgi:inosine-uridine nucleoside N-ribohydrolase
MGTMHKVMIRFALSLAVTLLIQTQAVTAKEQVIIDTDFAMPPQDDGLALIMAMNSPELEILGITTVAGNLSREQATVDALRILEIAGREEIPVFGGANMPLVHEKSEFAVRTYGEWYSDEPPREPPGGFPSKKPEPSSAIDFLVKTVKNNPGNITIIAIGPLTNIAMAIRQDAEFSGQVKQLYIMGGAIASLPDGAGNMTPNAEFNFWVDPEAAKVVLRSGIPIELSPLNVSRKTEFTNEHLEEIGRANTPLSQLIVETMTSAFERTPTRKHLMYDQVAVASAIDKTLVKRKEMYVDVDINPDINYGVSVGGVRMWPYAEGARKIAVQYDVDTNRFMRLFIERVTRSSQTAR